MTKKVTSVEVSPGIIVRIKDTKGREHALAIEADDVSELRDLIEKVYDAVWRGAIGEFSHRIVISGRVK